MSVNKSFTMYYAVWLFGYAKGRITVDLITLGLCYDNGDDGMKLISRNPVENQAFYRTDD
ncbi:MAG: hypothetical protein ACLSAC_06250 [Enterocloster bolteae]